MSSGYYSAIDEFIKGSHLNRDLAAIQKERPVEFENPFRFFESVPKNVSGSLYSWSTMTPEARLKAVEEFAVQIKPMPGETQQAFERRATVRMRDLCYIIMEESRSKTGSRQVAATAFNGLFPKEEKK